MLTKSALQRDLDRFYKAVNGRDFSVREVTKSAFSQARSKLNPSAFTELTDKILGTFYTQAPYLTFDGMRLLAIDGSTVPLPNHPSIPEAFGQAKGYGPDADSFLLKARTSLLYDPLNLTVLDASIGPLESGEREMAEGHLAKVGKGDLVMMDRGYNALWMLFLLMAKGAEFCVRLTDDWWLQVRDFAASGENERTVSFSLPSKDRHHLADFPEMWGHKIECRLVRVELEDGTFEYLSTSLTDTERYPFEIFGEMYHHRWGVGEAFKLFKERVCIEDWSGKTATAVKQDFHAKIFSMNFCAVMAFPIEERVRNEASNEGKHPRKINRTNALAIISEIILGIFAKGRKHEAIEAFDENVSKTTEIVRSRRKFPRKHRKKQPKSMNYKRL